MREPDFRTLFESAPGLYLVLTPEFRITAASDAYLRATMTKREAILGRDIFEVFPDNPDDPAATGVRNLGASLRRVLQNRCPDAMPIQKYDVRRPENEGGSFEVRYWSPLNAPVIGPGGELAYIIHRVEDVTEFVLLKEAGQAYERRAQALEVQAEQMEAEVYLRAKEVAEANRQLRAANDELSRLYGQIGNLMAIADQELRLPRAPAESYGGADAAIAPEEMLQRVGDLITRHMELGEQFRQSQKMEAVGRLAGGVAHDFNNLLTIITGNATFLRERYRPDAIPTELEDIERAAHRAAELTKQLLAFSRKQVLRLRVVDLNSIVTGMENFLRRLIGENIQFVTILGSALGRIKADPTQMEQVILNLAVNARDAMPNGGRLVIETRQVDSRGRSGALGAGPSVMMSVSDSGHGMNEETASRIFEPFFTTKAIGKGTGLGLSTVYGIVEQSGGTITVQSAPGEGATFRIYLPCTDEAEEPETAGAPAPKKEGAVVLLVEDEAPLRKLLHRTLTAAGHTVIEAASGEEALVRSQDQRIDLVLSDVVMPGMSGSELVTRLSSTRPRLIVLFMSGYDRELIDQKTLERTAGFLPKPFPPKTLLEKIAELLDSGADRRSVAS